MFRRRMILLELRPERCSETSPKSVEQIFSVLSQVNCCFSWWQRKARMSFELANVKGVVRFFVWCPQVLEKLIREQFMTHYVRCEVLKVDDYCCDWGFWVAGVDLCKRKMIDVLKTYDDFEDRLYRKLVDPLIALIGTLGNCGDGTAMQCVVEPLSWWRRLLWKGRACELEVSVPTFKGQIRVISRQSKMQVMHLASIFQQFVDENKGGLVMQSGWRGFGWLRCYRKRKIRKSSLYSVAELAMLFHLPMGEQPISGIVYSEATRLLSPNVLVEPAAGDVVIGATVGKGDGVAKKIGIGQADRRRHFYVLGKTGMGKSTLLLNMIVADIQAGRGVGVIDPHGDLIEQILPLIPSERVNDVIHFDPGDRDFPVALNVLETMGSEQNVLVASGLLSVFKKLYGHSWGPRLEHILRNTILSLLECPGANLLLIGRVLQDAAFRGRLLAKLRDPVLRLFWESEFNQMQDRLRTEAIGPIQNKVGQFLSSSMVRNILGQAKSTIDLRFAMDSQKIVLANLSKGRLGEDNSAMLGAMLVTKFQLAAMGRVDVPIEDRTDFYLYVDEFQNFATEAFVTILAEARKYGLNLILANQYLSQVPEEIRDAVFGNVGSMLVFALGVQDAEVMMAQFGEEVLLNDLLMMPKYHAVARLLVDGRSTRTFSLATLPPVEANVGVAHVAKIKRVSRQRYGRDRLLVEKQICKLLK